jgi:hypothetical protein
MTHLYTEEYFRLVAESWQRPQDRNKTPPPEQSGHDVRGRFIWEPIKVDEEVKDKEVKEVVSNINSSE